MGVVRRVIIRLSQWQERRKSTIRKDQYCQNLRGQSVRYGRALLSSQRAGEGGRTEGGAPKLCPIS